jgi:hypothetical protein
MAAVARALRDKLGDEALEGLQALSMTLVENGRMRCSR